MKISPYYVRARLFPTLLTILPLLIFFNVIVVSPFENKLKEVLHILPIITNLGLSSALLFFMVQINRLISKEVFQHLYFQDELFMPTTNYLLWANSYFDDTIKEKIRSKIQDKYGFELMSRDEEIKDEQTSRKQIVTAVSQIRNSLRNNTLLLQHNIEYGFFRNLIGGCIIAFLFSIAILTFGFIQTNQFLKISGIVSALTYLIPIIFSKPIIIRFGNYYSKILYEQFLSI